jgi:hypothetical protein
MNLLQHPIPSVNGDFPIIQYADDTLLIMQCSRQLLCLKALLKIFAQSTGLRVNFTKSCLLPINLSNEKAALWLAFLDANLEPSLSHTSASLLVYADLASVILVLSILGSIIVSLPLPLSFL